jgi:hypothetical protein
VGGAGRSRTHHQVYRVLACVPASGVAIRPNASPAGTLEAFRQARRIKVRLQFSPARSCRSAASISHSLLFSVFSDVLLPKQHPAAPSRAKHMSTLIPERPTCPPQHSIIRQHDMQRCRVIAKHSDVRDTCDLDNSTVVGGSSETTFNTSTTKSSISRTSVEFESVDVQPERVKPRPIVPVCFHQAPKTPFVTGAAVSAHP